MTHLKWPKMAKNAKMALAHAKNPENGQNH